jgi:BlaI family penicillinase repressor
MRLTHRELDIMSVLWDAGPSTVHEVRARLADADGTDLAYTSVQTFLRILEEKGCVAHELEGRAHRFRAIVSRDDATVPAIARLIDKLFAGSAGLLAAHLVRDHDLDASELRKLRRLLAKRIDGDRKAGPGASHLNVPKEKK